MDFRNLTPFDALAYEAVDAQDREYHVVALAVGYALRPIADAEQAAMAQAGQAWRPTHEAVLLDQAPHTAALCLADTHWGDPATSSLVRESDLVPYKPRCDVTVVGSAYSPEPAREFQARLRLEQGGHALIDKSLTLTGPRHFARRGALIARLLRAVSEARVYTLTRPEPVTEVPLHYELAFGGRCAVFKPTPPAAPTPEAAPQPLINEVCLRNPVGAGWMAEGYLRALAQTPQGMPPNLPAPSISIGKPLTRMVCSKPVGALTPQAMAAVRYPHEVAGFSAVGKAWAPRLALAGTADDAWQAERAPALPLDFDFGFWNGAPADQQIPFPDLGQGLRLLSLGLLPQGDPLRVQLPHHRAYTLMRLSDGLVLPNPMQIDLIELDNQDAETPRLRLVFRTAVLKNADPRVLEARFETDPTKPLFTLSPSRDYAKPDAYAMQQQLELEKQQAQQDEPQPQPGSHHG